MRTMTLVAVFIALSVVAGCFVTQLRASNYREICFNTGHSVSGLYRTCYYSCPSGKAAISIRSYEICPISISH